MQGLARYTRMKRETEVLTSLCREVSSRMILKKWGVVEQNLSGRREAIAQLQELSGHAEQ